MRRAARVREGRRGDRAVGFRDAPCWTFAGTGGASRARYRAMSQDRPGQPSPPDYGRRNRWDREFQAFSPMELPTYVGPVTYCKQALVEDPAELNRRRPDVAIVGVPFDDGVSYRSGARFGPRAIREATYTQGEYSLQQQIAPFDVLDVVDA